MTKRNPDTPKLPISTAEISRACRGILNLGLSVEKIEIHPRTGQIVVHPGPALTSIPLGKVVA